MRARPLILVTFAALVGSAHAQRTDIYKCVDASGRASYTNDRRETAGRKCELVTTQINVAPLPAPPARQTRSPSTFPKETASQRASAAGRQRDILEKELATEQQLLEKARQALAQQEQVRTGEERNYAKVLERLQPYKDSIETHEKNIEALRRELANLNR
jgi:chromosome segregation ATPase